MRMQRMRRQNLRLRALRLDLGPIYLQYIETYDTQYQRCQYNKETDT
jgi:hypothetical protein